MMKLNFYRCKITREGHRRTSWQTQEKVTSLTETPNCYKSYTQYNKHSIYVSAKLRDAYAWLSYYLSMVSDEDLRCDSSLQNFDWNSIVSERCDTELYESCDSVLYTTLFARVSAQVMVCFLDVALAFW